MAFKESEENKVEVTCDICGADFRMGFLRTGMDQFEKVSVHVSLNLEKEENPKMFGSDNKYILFFHVCHPCRKTINDVVEVTIAKLKKPSMSRELEMEEIKDLRDPDYFGDPLLEAYRRGRA